MYRSRQKKSSDPRGISRLRFIKAARFGEKIVPSSAKKNLCLVRPRGLPVSPLAPPLVFGDSRMSAVQIILRSLISSDSMGESPGIRACHTPEGKTM